MKKRVVSCLRIVVPVTIIVWLCVHVQRSHPEAIQEIRTGSKDWFRLSMSGLVILLATCISFVRWHLLIRALNIPMRLGGTLRLGFLGYLLNFVSPGHVGGDLFKAVFIARQQTGRRAEAVATILIDRACGLYGLLLVTSAALLFTNLMSISQQVRLVAQMTFVLIATGTVLIVLLMNPRFADGRWAQSIGKTPVIGAAAQRFFAALRLFRNNKSSLVLVGAMSISVHLLIAVGLYLGASGVYTGVPSLGQHFVISPLAGAAGAIPLTPGGLGSYELAMSYLYDLLSSPQHGGRGVVVALWYRLTTIAVAAVGMVFYWASRREVDQVMHDAQEEAEHEELVSLT